MISKSIIIIFFLLFFVITRIKLEREKKKKIVYLMIRIFFISFFSFFVSFSFCLTHQKLFEKKNFPRPCFRLIFLFWLILAINLSPQGGKPSKSIMCCRVGKTFCCIISNHAFEHGKRPQFFILGNMYL